MTADVLRQAIAGTRQIGAATPNLAVARGAVVTQRVSAIAPATARSGGIGVLDEPSVSPKPAVSTVSSTPAGVPNSSGVAASSNPSGKPSAAQRLSALAKEDTVQRAERAVERGSIASMAAAKTLTRLLGAIYHKPGALASNQDKRDALVQLSADARSLAMQYLQAMRSEPSDYNVAMAMDACVSLTCAGWESGVSYDWPAILTQAVSDQRLVEASTTLSHAIYIKATSEETARDRLNISIHSAFWKLYQSGDKINGMDASRAAYCIDSMAAFLNEVLVEKSQFVSSPDLSVAWMQGSIGRLSDLLLAELTARQARDAQWVVTDQELSDALALSRDGFRSVEKFAQDLLRAPVQTPSTNDVPA